MSLFEAIVIAIVEGLTEFLPISSTGHMIITSALLSDDLHKQEFTKLFEVAITYYYLSGLLNKEGNFQTQELTHKSKQLKSTPRMNH